ncbi:hypothetical protein [Helicobacter sp. T3_23-1059]
MRFCATRGNPHTTKSCHTEVFARNRSISKKQQRFVILKGLARSIPKHRFFRKSKKYK